MFNSRRYQRVSQNVDSDSDSDETTLFTSQNGSSGKGEWQFGVRAYDLSQDLNLPQIRAGRPSLRTKKMKGYSRKRALFGACIFIIIVAAVTGLAVLFLMNQTYIVKPAPTDELPTDCEQAPTPLVGMGGPPDGKAPPPRPPCKTTTQQKPPTTQAIVSSSSEPVPDDRTEPPSDGPPTEIPPATTSSPPSETTENSPTTMTSSSVQPTDVLSTISSSDESLTNENIASDLATEELPTECEQAPKPLVDFVGTDGRPPDSKAPPPPPCKTTTQQKTPTTQPTISSSSALETTPTEAMTTPSNDDQQLNNWSENMQSSEVTTQQPPTTISMTTTSVTTTESAVHGDLTSKPSEDITTSSPSEGVGTDSPSPIPRSIDWEQDFFPGLSEATMELVDMNSDGVMDVIVIEDFSQCAVRVLALDGKTGQKFWQKEVNFPAFAIRCELDVNGDGEKDCLVTGRGGGFVAIDRKDGSLLWSVDPSIVFPPYNFYFPLIVDDLNNDGVDDIINMHGGDVSYNPNEHDRSPAYLVVISGKTGQSLIPPILTPDGHESYMSPVLFKLNGKDDLILFGSGGETVAGSLWAISLMSLKKKVFIGKAYTPFVNDTYHPCFTKDTDFNEIRPTFRKDAFDFTRPIFLSPPNSNMRFCPRWADVKPIWNIYGVCLYELVRSEVKGVMVPPVLVDLNLDSIDDLVVSTFDGHTIALNGSDATTRLWDVHYPNTESYSVPAPLYYNKDSVPDLIIRTNHGEWNEYNVSSIRLLDGRNGAEIWSFDSAHTGMMSSLSIASRSPGSDAMLFMTIGTLDTNTDPSFANPDKGQHKVRRRDNHNKNADIGKLDAIDGEAEEDNDDHGAVDYDNSDFMNRVASSSDPPGLWISTPEDQFPDPKFDLDGFIIYCGESFGRLTAYLWLVTREMIESGAEIQPIATHEPFFFTLPEAPPTDSSSPNDFPPDGSPPDNFDPNNPPSGQNSGPPPSVEGSHFTKRHGETDDPDPVGGTQVSKKMQRCSHISAPLQIIASPAVGDFDSDGRLDVTYSVVWASPVAGKVGVLPELKVFGFTMEERYTQVVGEEVKGRNLVDFKSFLPADQQPWSRYMGRYGNNVYHREDKQS